MKIKLILPILLFWSFTGWTATYTVTNWSVYICCDGLIKSINSIFELWQRNMRMILR
jgi:hypothetical protein